MKFCAKAIFLAALAALTASPKSFAQQHNDFTEGNLTLDRSKIEKKESRFQDEKSGLREKQFSPKPFIPKDDGAGAKALREKNSELKGGASAEIMSGKKNDRYKKGFSAPELNRFDGKFDIPELNAVKNHDRNLTRKYEGSIDFSKRNYRDGEMQEFLEKVSEKSMQDINKYMFRSSRSTEPGMPTTQAGEQLGLSDVKTNSIKDFLFGAKKIERPTVAFTKDMNVGAIKSSKAMDLAEAKKTAAPPPNAKILPAQVIGEKPKPRVPQTSPERKIKVAEKEVVLNSQGMFAPKDGSQKQSRYKIKVEVSEKEQK